MSWVVSLSPAQFVPPETPFSVESQSAWTERFDVDSRRTCARGR